MGEQILKDTASHIVKRRRRRRSDVKEVLKSDLPNNLPNPIESSEHSIGEIGSVTSLNQPNIGKPDLAINNNEINLIRPKGYRSAYAELLEDTHHSKIAESDYSDDTHDWGWDNPEISNEYWHFLGRYE